MLFSGGQGGRGGRGIECEYKESSGMWVNAFGSCIEGDQTAEASRGANGKKGKDGQGKLLAI